MKLNEIITLLNAGYTKADIDALDAADNITAPDPAGKAAGQEPDPEPEKKNTDTAGGSAPAGSDVLQTLQATVADLAKSVKAMQADNLNKARQEDKTRPGAESAIANFMKRM